MDRKKKDGNQKQAGCSVQSDDGSGPKAQRQQRSRAPQEQRMKGSSNNADRSVKDKISDPTLPSSQPDSKSGADLPDTAELFANLKRETDDINALKAKKTHHRQIFSNWARYEEPLPGPDHEAELQGADFEALLKAPISGHFQFKHERAWDANITPLSGELFSLDVDLLALGLETIPLYQKLDLPSSLFLADKLEDMDYYAKQCAAEYETMKNRLSRKHNKNDSDAIVRLLKEGSPVPAEKDMSDKETFHALGFDIAQSEVQSDPLETEAVNNDTNSKSDVKEVLGADSEPDINQVIPPQKIGSGKITSSKDQPSVTDSEMQRGSISVEETDIEPKVLRKVIPPTVTSRTEIEQPSEIEKSEITKQTVQQTHSELNLTEHVEEPIVPLGQRSSRCKARSQVQAAEVQKIDSRKSQQMNDLDFVLSLKNPLKEAHISSLKPSQVKVSNIEEDDDSTGPNSSQLLLMTPQKQTQDLEDWLDSMLDD